MYIHIWPHNPWLSRYKIKSNSWSSRYSKKKVKLPPLHLIMTSVCIPAYSYLDLVSHPYIVYKSVSKDNPVKDINVRPVLLQNAGSGAAHFMYVTLFSKTMLLAMSLVCLYSSLISLYSSVIKIGCICLQFSSLRLHITDIPKKAIFYHVIFMIGGRHQGTKKSSLLNLLDKFFDNTNK
jgi:hypothetical protein